MPFHDQWGHDPNVQMMRRIFSLLENTQKELLRVIDISPFDLRLRRARNYSRDLFEQFWPIAMQKGIVSSEDETSHLYWHCLAHALKWSGIKTSAPPSNENDKIARFLQEKLK